MKSPSIIVLGGLNTDIVLGGADRLLGPGELCTCESLTIAPGGKSRNIAQMTANLTEEGTVAMVGKTCRDTYGLWEVPLKALRDSGVNVDHVTILENGMPGIAVIPVDRSGRNQIYLYPGVNSDFNAVDVDKAESLFRDAGAERGILALTLEMPLATAMHAIRLAKRYQLRVVLDPGGIHPDPSAEHMEQYRAMLALGIDVLKPNEHEARILTGITVRDTESAGKAGDKLRDMGAASSLITAGGNGAYLVMAEGTQHLPIPEVKYLEGTRDETGCGDQTMAAICAELASGSTIRQASEKGILAGTIQFGRRGVQPLTREDIETES